MLLASLGKLLAPNSMNFLSGPSQIKPNQTKPLGCHQHLHYNLCLRQIPTTNLITATPPRSPTTDALALVAAYHELFHPLKRRRRRRRFHTTLPSSRICSGNRPVASSAARSNPPHQPPRIIVTGEQLWRSTPRRIAAQAVCQRRKRRGGSARERRRRRDPKPVRLSGSRVKDQIIRYTWLCTSNAWRSNVVTILRWIRKASLLHRHSIPSRQPIAIPALGSAVITGDYKRILSECSKFRRNIPRGLQDWSGSRTTMRG